VYSLVGCKQLFPNDIAVRLQPNSHSSNTTHTALASTTSLAFMNLKGTRGELQCPGMQVLGNGFCSVASGGSIPAYTKNIFVSR